MHWFLYTCFLFLRRHIVTKVLKSFPFLDVSNRDWKTVFLNSVYQFCQTDFELSWVWEHKCLPILRNRHNAFMPLMPQEHSHCTTIHHYTIVHVCQCQPEEPWQIIHFLAAHVWRSRIRIDMSTTAETGSDRKTSLMKRMGDTLIIGFITRCKL